jgi:hypothetical protein
VKPLCVPAEVLVGRDEHFTAENAEIAERLHHGLRVLRVLRYEGLSPLSLGCEIGVL